MIYNGCKPVSSPLCEETPVSSLPDMWLLLARELINVELP